MAGYGDIVASSQDLYSASAEGAAGFSEGIGQYRGEMREIDAKEKRINQIGDAAFSLFQGYSEGKQEHTEAGQAAEAAGFEYEQPESLWETWKGVDEGASFSRIGESKENFGKAQTITGTELKNMSDLYKAGGMKAVGNVEDYGTFRDTGSTGWSPESAQTLGLESKAGVKHGAFHETYMKDEGKAGADYRKLYYQENINEANRQARTFDTESAETVAGHAIDMFGEDLYSSWVSGRNKATRQLKGFE